MENVKTIPFRNYSPYMPYYQSSSILNMWGMAGLFFWKSQLFSKEHFQKKSQQIFNKWLLIPKGTGRAVT